MIEPIALSARWAKHLIESVESKVERSQILPRINSEVRLWRLLSRRSAAGRAKRSIGDRGSWRKIDDGSPNSSHRVERATPSGVMTATCDAAMSTAFSALP
jgi:hypothetical protein